jgi:hypothetical protein
MREVTIYQNLEYNTLENIDESVVKCPWTYPSINHPNTLFLWKGISSKNKALSIKFNASDSSEVLTTKFYCKKSEKVME